MKQVEIEVYRTLEDEVHVWLPLTCLDKTLKEIKVTTKCKPGCFMCCYGFELVQVEPHEYMNLLMHRCERMFYEKTAKEFRFNIWGGCQFLDQEYKCKIYHGPRPQKCKDYFCFAVDDDGFPYVQDDYVFKDCIKEGNRLRVEFKKGKEDDPSKL